MARCIKIRKLFQEDLQMRGVGSARRCTVWATVGSLNTVTACIHICWMNRLLEKQRRRRCLQSLFYFLPSFLLLRKPSTVLILAVRSIDPRLCIHGLWKCFVWFNLFCILWSLKCSWFFFFLVNFNPCGGKLECQCLWSLSCGFHEGQDIERSKRKKKIESWMQQERKTVLITLLRLIFFCVLSLVRFLLLPLLFITRFIIV